MVPKALNRVPSALYNLGFRPQALTLVPVALQRDSGSSIVVPKAQPRAGDKCSPHEGRCICMNKSCRPREMGRYRHGQSLWERRCEFTARCKYRGTTLWYKEGVACTIETGNTHNRAYLSAVVHNRPYQCAAMHNRLGQMCILHNSKSAYCTIAILGTR